VLLYVLHPTHYSITLPARRAAGAASEAAETTPADRFLSAPSVTFLSPSPSPRTPCLSSPLLSSFLPVLWPAAGRAHLLAAGRSWRRRGRSWSRSSWWWRSSWRQERRRRQGMPRCRRSSGGVSCSGSGRCTATSTVSTRRRSPALRYLPLPTHPFRPSHHGARSLHPCLSKISFSFVSL
jgi:hypothetical protein